MRLVVLLGLVIATVSAKAQTCPGATTFNPCELTFDSPRAVVLDAEFRSPTYTTFKMPAFWNGKQMVIRFSPTEPGAWVYRLTSPDASFQGKTGEFTAGDSGSPGFIQVDNTRAWSYTLKRLANASREAHLWMGFDCTKCLDMSRAAFDKLIVERASQNFNHAVVTMPSLDVAQLAEFDARVAALSTKGIFTDLQFADTTDTLRGAFPTPAERDRFARDMVARYAAFRLTWQGVSTWETGAGARDVLREVGLALKKYDPYGHPRSSGAVTTSSGLLGDGWMTHVVANASSPDADQLGSIESQTVRAPRIARGASGEGFARRLWAATVSGQYPTFSVENDAEAKSMAAWHELMSRTRFWEMEPYFDVDNARALYLTGIEYVAFADKPGTVDILTERKGYQVYWMNLATGTIEKQKKDYKGERFSDKPPGPGPWVLHLSRDGRKEGMAKSYYFESRRVLYQELESNPQKIPFEFAAPIGDEFPIDKPISFEIKLARESRATRDMAYALTIEATVNGQGARVLATGPKGEFTIPANIAATYPAVANLHLVGRNANGKIYAVDRVIRVTK